MIGKPGKNHQINLIKKFKKFEFHIILPINESINPGKTQLCFSKTFRKSRNVSKMIL